MAYGLATMQRERRLHIRRGEPIRECGLDLFPITMDHYEDFIQCKDALCLRLSSLPVRYVSLDYLSAVFALEFDALQKGQDDLSSSFGGLFFRLMRLFGLSLRIEMTAEKLNECIFYRASEGNISIEYMELTQTGADGNPNTVRITPFQFSSTLRPLIAAQNQIILPDESENAELVDAYEKKKQIQKGAALKTDLDDLVSSVAYHSGVSDAEIMDWNVRDFENRRRAIERDKRYMLYAQAEMSGMVTFKNGNPYPSWCFDALDDTLGTMEYAELAKTLSGAAAPGSGLGI